MSDIGPQSSLGRLFDGSMKNLEYASAKLWVGIISLLGLILVMWLINIIGLHWWNLIPGILGFLLIGMLGFSPVNLVASLFAGGATFALQDKDKTQGIATGPAWLARIMSGVTHAYFLCAYALILINFKPYPMIAWILALLTVGFVLRDWFFQIKSETAQKIVGGYLLTVAVLAVLSHMFGDIYEGIAAQKAVDFAKTIAADFGWIIDDKWVYYLLFALAAIVLFLFFGKRGWAALVVAVTLASIVYLNPPTFTTSNFLPWSTQTAAASTTTTTSSTLKTRCNEGFATRTMKYGLGNAMFKNSLRVEPGQKYDVLMCPGDSPVLLVRNSKLVKVSLSSKEEGEVISHIRAQEVQGGEPINIANLVRPIYQDRKHSGNLYRFKLVIQDDFDEVLFQYAPFGLVVTIESK